MLGQHQAPVHAVAGSRGGSGVIVSAGGDDVVRSWDALSGAAAGFAVEMSTSMSYVDLVEVPGAAVVVCADGTAVHRFDLASGRRIGDRLRPPGFDEMTPVHGIGPVVTWVDGDSATVFAGFYLGRVHRWDLMSGEPIGAYWRADRARVLAMAVTRPSGGRLTVITSGQQDREVRRWDALTGEAIGAPLRGSTGPVTALVCVPGVDGRDVVFGQEWRGPIHRWDAATGESIGAPLPQTAPHMNHGDFAVTPDRQVLISLDASGTPRLWNLTEPDPVPRPLATSLEGVESVATVATPGAPLIVVGSPTDGVLLFDVEGRPVREVVPSHPVKVWDVDVVAAAPGSGGRAVIVSRSRDGLRCWDATILQPFGRNPQPAGYAWAGGWLPDGRLMLATGSDEGLHRVDPVAGPAPLDLDEDMAGDELRVTDVAVGTWPDGRLFFATGGEDGAVHLVDAATGEEIREPLEDPESQWMSVAVTTLPDGTVMVASTGEDLVIQRWNAVTGQRIGEPLTGLIDGGDRLAFRALTAGRTLLAAQDRDGRILRWDAVSGESLGEPLRPPGDSVTLARAAPGHLLVACGGGIARCWDGGTGRHLGDVPGIEAATTMTGSDGRLRLVVGYADGRIGIIDTPKPSEND